MSVVRSHRGFDVVAVADELIAMLFFTKNDGLSIRSARMLTPAP